MQINAVAQIPPESENLQLALKAAIFIQQELFLPTVDHPVNPHRVLIAMRQAVTVAALDDSERVLAAGSLWQSESGKGDGLIGNVVAAHDNRGVGLGRQVMSSLEDIAEDLEVRRLFLKCRPHVEGFYTSLGYRKLFFRSIGQDHSWFTKVLYHEPRPRLTFLDC